MKKVMDFTPNKRLRLKEAFADQKVFQVVSNDMDYLECLFEWTDRGKVFIIDDAVIGHSIFVFDTHGLGTDKTFKIINRQHKDLFLWHIDGVLYYADSKCDCAFLTDDSLSFVEFKANAANNTEATIKGNYDKVKLQSSIKMSVSPREMFLPKNFGTSEIILVILPIALSLNV